MGFDTVVAWDNGRVYFFSGSEYWAWEVASRSVPPGYPRQIADGWAGVFPAGLDAILWGNGGKAYVFKGADYVRYLIGPDHAEAGFPRPYGPAWRGLWPSGLDATVNWNNGKSYVFKGAEYIRYDMASDRADDGYPLLIGAQWPGIWDRDLDAAIVLPGTTTAYFFKGAECIRYDTATNVAGPPTPISTEFPGVPVPGAAPPPPPPVASWFIDSAAHPVRQGNAVTAFTDGDSYFADLTAAIRAASGAAAFVELAAWDCQLDFPLVAADATSTLRTLLTDASARGVEIRALLNRHQLRPFGGGTVSGFDNTAAATFVDSLPTGSAIHDDRYLNAGTHHQKFAVVGSEAGLVAWSGGMDPNPNRLTTNPTVVLHDVQVRVTGPAAHDHHRLFADRWTDNPLAASKRALPTPAVPGPAGALQVQVVRTAGNGTAHPGIPPGAGAATPGYTFAPTGDRSVRELVLHAIGAAQRFVYLEDQYLVDMATSAALLAALPRLTFVVILMPHTTSVNGELHQGWRRRKEFLDPLLAAAPGKVAVCWGNPLYIHSKTWVVDDQLAIVGSANCNRRGYTHDSEQAVGVFESTADGSWAHALRKRLWAKHLGVAESAVHDPVASWGGWVTPSATAHVVHYDVNGGTDTAGFPLSTATAWDTLIDPDGA